jgi:hypothetical protein
MNGYYLTDPYPERDSEVTLVNAISDWTPQARGTLNGHPVRRMQAYYYRSDEVGYRCLDGNGAGNGGKAWAKLCNNGDNQHWEIFQNSNGSITFKNVGAWTHSGLHLCLSADWGYVVKLATCNANSAWQQWV